MKKTVILILCVCAVCGLRAQSAITFCGGNAYSGVGTMSYTCGEVAVSRASDHSITIVDLTQYFTEGVQQAFIAKTLDIEQVPDLDMRVYPNPTTDVVTLESGNTEYELRYELFSLKGEALKRGELVDGKDVLDVSQYPAGTYMLSVSVGEKRVVKVYKIVKK